jgi:hypothetical protein
MVTFKTKMDPSCKIYIAKPLRQSGLVNTIEIVPNSKAAVIFQAGTRLEDVLLAIRIIAQEIEHRIQTEEAFAA